MGKLVQFVTSLHQATSRAYIDRMVDDKVLCMLKPKNMKKIIGMEIAAMVMVAIDIWLGVGNLWPKN